MYTFLVYIPDLHLVQEDSCHLGLKFHLHLYHYHNYLLVDHHQCQAVGRQNAAKGIKSYTDHVN